MREYRVWSIEYRERHCFRWRKSCLEVGAGPRTALAAFLLSQPQTANRFHLTLVGACGPRDRGIGRMTGPVITTLLQIGQHVVLPLPEAVWGIFLLEEKWT